MEQKINLFTFGVMIFEHLLFEPKDVGTKIIFSLNVFQAKTSLRQDKNMKQIQYKKIY